MGNFKKNQEHDVSKKNWQVVSNDRWRLHQVKKNMPIQTAERLFSEKKAYAHPAGNSVHLISNSGSQLFPFDSVILFDTLWLCQNSNWKWP